MQMRVQQHWQERQIAALHLYILSAKKPIAESLSENFVTQADTWEELRAMVIDATQGYFFDSKPPEFVRLHLRRDEVLILAPHPANTDTL